MTWVNAYLRGLLIFVYFVVATVIVPDIVVRLDVITGAPSVVQDLVVPGVWAAGLVGGLYLLRRFQRTGLI